MNMKLIMENWKTFIDEAHGIDTSWETETKKVTIQDVFNIIGQDCAPTPPNRPCKALLATNLLKKLKYGLPNLDPERVAKVAKADLQYPLIVIVDSNTGEYQYILDGNHRLQKAIDDGAEVKVKEFYTDEYEKLFGN